MKFTDTILFPVDTDSDYTGRLDLLNFLAKKLNTKVVVLTVLPDKIDNEVLRKKLHKAVESDLEKVAEKLKASGTEVKDLLVKYGKASEAIAAAGEQSNAGFILSESRDTGKQGSYNLGTVTMRLLRESEKPVWVTLPGQKAEVKNIICPTDFSKPADTALDNAVMLAKILDAKLRVLAVDESLPAQNSDSWDKNDEKKFDAFKQEFQKYLEKFDTVGLDITKQAESGEPHEVILNSIKENGHDLLIMGTTGRTGLQRLFMGSVTEKVIREVPCAFITTKSEDFLQLRINNDITEFTYHFETGEKLMEKGFYDKALEQFNICLKINSMHVPSLFKISKIYEIKDNPDKSKHYNDLAMNVLNKVWDKQIEQEIRKHYR